MAGVHRSDHVSRLDAAHLTDDQPVGPHPKGVAHQVTQRNLAHALLKAGKPAEALQVAQLLLDKFTESQALVQLPDQNQTTVRGDARSLEIHFNEALKEN